MAIDYAAMSEKDRAALKHGRIGVKNEPRSKYRNEAAIYNGVRYSSKAEAERAKYEDYRLSIGVTAWWLRQVRIPMSDVEAYVIDFVVAEKIGEYVLDGETMQSVRIYGIDVKGFETPKFKRVKRWWRKRGPFDLLVFHKGKGEFIKPESKL